MNQINQMNQKDQTDRACATRADHRSSRVPTECFRSLLVHDLVRLPSYSNSTAAMDRGA
jgi:hypothetical protein